ncbi:MAG TPA: PTS sugar transporter subunit IIA [Candidatus Hydrogenedentes bacterium]|nr:PTS sugar transporter subunit IIA [Candidatus Hydrogenedentota bacterium]HOJ67442.1 PTS sugar transporter subunit IIA [Candidatus Hydrogenedentota bacterium]HOK88939.1 PTS sugar transporter subunit IIA [Candidatus Hydrogenedentota bacterium]HPO31277.1 PTS sugar transporter subunit IIA [Candidatus Hydrogenedentota bacterium]
MDTLLDALQEGRLFELPENDKNHALQFLAHIIEAFPEVPAGTDVVGHVMKREEAYNTALGKGWACPHARVPFDEDLMCVIGWSPTGIDYNAPDGQPVSVVVMYLVPDNQRNHYLREISSLARALESFPSLEKLREVRDLDDVRNFLLDLITQSKDAGTSETRARMIRLQTKAVPEPVVFHDLSNLIIEPVTIITAPDIRPIALTQNADLMRWLDGVSDLASRLAGEGGYRNGGWQLLRRSAASYQGGRVLYECVAVKLLPARPAGQPSTS